MAKRNPLQKRSLPVKLSERFSKFFESNKAGGILLIFCTVVSLILANSFLSNAYDHLWSKEIHVDFLGLHFPHHLVDWIDDGLMTIFFLLVGLEIKRELIIGELNTVKTAMLPVMAAIGGMLFPALIFLLVNKGHTEFMMGAGIPTATDIAFAIAILSILGDKIPNSFKVFLTALAIIDDLGAILIIAIFYGGHIAWFYLLAMLLIAGLMLFLNKKGIQNIFVYSILGLILWVCTLQSGIHATIAGVIMAFCIPFGDGSKTTVSGKLISLLERPVNFLIMPFFALGNTAIHINSEMINGLGSALPIGIFLGLILGKPIGIYLGAIASSKLGLAEINNNISKKMIVGGGFLGGIGFTMSIFVTNLAFDQTALINISKLSIILASVSAASIGYGILAQRKK
jgi:NhaA family Na+:H+ antiporter